MTGENHTISKLECRVLGPVDVVRGGESVPLAPKQRALLALLLLNSGRIVSRDRIVDSLWNDRPPRVVGDAIRFHVTRLRRALDPDGGDSSGATLVAEHGGYCLTIDEEMVDANRFERLVALAGQRMAEDSGSALADCDRALAMWRGPPLADVAYEDFAAMQIRHLESLRRMAFELRIEALIRLEREDEAIAGLEHLVVEYPLYQGFGARLLELLNGCGRPADALSAYEAVRIRYLEELGIEPPEELRRLANESRLLIADPAWTDPTEPRHNIPRPITTYVESEGEIDEIRAIVSDRRLVTLLGPGGVGKTRLAVEAVRGIVSEYRDGAWFIDLGVVADDAQVASAIANTVGTAEGTAGSVLDGAVAHLSRRELLLVLDNCEHVGRGCADAANRLLAACPQLRILATSREPLGVAGEVVVPVDPLPLPEPGASLDEMATTPSARLFIDRAADASRFDLTEDGVEALGTLMIRLAGLPLAIEMAAARTRSVQPDGITARLNSHLDYLRSDVRGVARRHRSLTATFRWSYDLLPELERRIFRRLSVFRGDSTIDAMASVAGSDPTPEFVDAVGELVDASLLLRSADRYRMLEPIREFAGEVLEEQREIEETLDRHLRTYEGLARSRRIVEGRDPASPPRVRDGVDRIAVVESTGRDIGNYRVAYQRALRVGDRAGALEIAAGISGYLTHHLEIRENTNTLTAALAIEGDAPDGLIVDALLGLAWSQADLGENVGAEASAQKALELSRGIGYDLGEVDALLTLGNAALERGDLRLALERLIEARDAHVSQDPPPVLVNGVAHVSLYLGDVTTAEEILSMLEREQLDDWIAADVQRQRGMIESIRGNHRAALTCFEESMRRCSTERNQTEKLRLVAYQHLNLGDLDRAEALGSHLHERHLETGVPTYIEKTTNLLGLIAVRTGRVEEGMRRIFDALDSAYSRGDRYQAWRYLHSAAEALLALGTATEASAILRFADEVADENGYWLRAIEWRPLIDRSALESLSAGTEVAPISGFEQAIEIVRSDIGTAWFSDRV